MLIITLSCYAHLRNRGMPFELVFPTPSLPMMLFHSLESRPPLALKSPSKISLSRPTLALKSPSKISLSRPTLALKSPSKICLSMPTLSLKSPSKMRFLA